MLHGNYWNSVVIEYNTEVKWTWCLLTGTRLIATCQRLQYISATNIPAVSWCWVAALPRSGWQTSSAGCTAPAPLPPYSPIAGGIWVAYYLRLIFNLQIQNFIVDEITWVTNYKLPHRTYLRAVSILNFYFYVFYHKINTDLRDSYSSLQ